MKSIDETEFKSMFVPNSNALSMGIKLRALVQSCFNNIEENIAGGAKVKLALYSRGGNNNVLCGIQQSSNDTCMLYVHHIDAINHERLKFSGKGKHAKRVKFAHLNEIIKEDVIWLLTKVNENAPY